MLCKECTYYKICVDAEKEQSVYCGLRNGKYVVEKCIDGNWYYHGTYESLTAIGESCLMLGDMGIKQVRVKDVSKNSILEEIS